MLDYRAPLDDMQFVIKNLIGMESLGYLYGNSEFSEDSVPDYRGSPTIRTKL